MPPFTLSKHAIERILDMAVEPDEIRNAFEQPKNDHRSELTGARYLTRGRVTLVVGDTSSPPVVITVFWANPNAWSEDSGRGEYGSAGADLAANRAAFKARRRVRGKK